MRLFFLLFLLLPACATLYSTSNEYKEVISEDEQQSAHRCQKTTVLFLIDGLSTRTLQLALSHGLVPQIQNHFLSQGQSGYLAHSVFPSLTFPNISSLLHEKPVHVTGHTGNSIISHGRLIQFEEPLDRIFFSEEMIGSNVFERLRNQGFRSVSLDYGLGVDASVSSKLTDLNTGIALRQQDYAALDQNRIQSLRYLLSRTDYDQWPEFIFIHIIGNDFLSHQKGAQSPTVLNYLSTLDRNFTDLFSILREAEKKGHATTTVLTADHGFAVSPERHLPLDEYVNELNPQLRILNEGRMASVYSPFAPSEEQLAQWTGQLLSREGIEIVGYRNGKHVRLVSKNLDFSFDYVSGPDCGPNGIGLSIQGGPMVCSHQLSSKIRDQFYPYFIENISSFFDADHYPDVVVIADPVTAFHEREAFMHGGPTREEIFVPLLLRNAKLPVPSEIPALWQLFQEPPLAF